MTSTISQSTSDPKPGKPWEPTVKERSQKVLQDIIKSMLAPKFVQELFRS